MDLSELWLPLTLITYLLFSAYRDRNFAQSTYNYVTLRDLEPQLSTSLEPNRSVPARPLCPALPEYGYQAINSIKRNTSFWSMGDVEDFDEKNLAMTYDLEPGGVWRPKDCVPVHHVNIIVPYRDRPEQLRKFVTYMHGFLHHQMLHYKIIVVEQKDDRPFNRGKLLNIGFTEALKQGWTQCFVFHDVDLLPESLHNIYGCTSQPRHMSAMVNSFRYNLQYPELFGGAIAITGDLFKAVNGFSNRFFGWGGEDDDLFSRLIRRKAVVFRLSPTISAYRMLPHLKAALIETRYTELSLGEKYDLDGLDNLKYSITNHIAGPLYTIIQVRL